MKMKKFKRHEEDIESAEEEDKENITMLENNDNILSRSQRIKKFPDRYNDCVFLTFEEAMNNKGKKKWMRAIQEEFSEQK